MQKLDQLAGHLQRGENLLSAEASLAAKAIADEQVSFESKYGFLVALADKGETATEVAAFAASFRDLAVNPGVEAWADRAIDVCGTGGDGAQTFNISTAVSFILAAAGVPVFKHGNRSITSKCGSADLLEALGFDLQASQERQRSSLDSFNFCFFFAPSYHPAFKEIMPVRKALAQEGRRTIFNLLGPLINPGRPAFQLMGVYSHKWVRPLAQSFEALGLRAGLVVNGQPTPEQTLDELSCAGVNSLAGYGRLAGFDELPSLADLGLRPCMLESLKGGDVAANLKLMLAFIDGDLESLPVGLQDSIYLNAGAGLWIAEKAESLAEGIGSARELVQGGRVKGWLSQVQSFHLQQ